MNTPHLFRVVEGPLDGDSVPDCGETLCLGPHRYHKSDQSYVYEGIVLTTSEADPEEAEALAWVSDREPTAALPETPPTPAPPPAREPREFPFKQPELGFSSVERILDRIADVIIYSVFLLVVISMTFRAPVIGLGILIAGLLLRWIWKAATK